MQQCNVGRGLVWLACLLGGLLTTSALAQDVPFQGVVVEDHVDVLSGGSRKFYVVAYLNKGTIVTVKEVIEGYNAITPPTNAASFISKAYVDAKGDGKTGVVSADHALVKAANVNGSADSWTPQVDLQKGAAVQILGEDGSFYKIVTPPTVSVYLPPGSVRRLEIPVTPPPQPAPTPVETIPPPAPPAPAEAKPVEAPPAPAQVSPAEAPAPPPAPPSKPVEVANNPPAASPAPSPAVTPTPPAPIVENAIPVPNPTPAPEPPQPKKHKHSMPAQESSTAWQPSAQQAPAAPVLTQAKAQTPQVQALEARLAAAQQLPLEQRPLDELLAAYESAGNDPSLPLRDRRIVMSRTLQLKRSQDLANMLKSLQQTSDQAGGATPMTVPSEAAQPPDSYRQTHYDLVGQIMASGVYDGDSGPRLFRLVEPSSNRTLAYIQPGKLDPARILGRIVGINGQSKYDPALKLSVVSVTGLEVLEPATTQPAGK